MSCEINALTHKLLERVSTSGSYKMNRGNIHAPSRQVCERSYIFSWEVLNSMNQQRKGHPLGELSERAIMQSYYTAEIKKLRKFLTKQRITFQMG